MYPLGVAGCLQPGDKRHGHDEMSLYETNPDLLRHVTHGLYGLAGLDLPPRKRICLAAFEVAVALIEPDGWPSKELYDRAVAVCDEIGEYRDAIRKRRGKGIDARTKRLGEELLDIMIEVERAIGARMAS